MCEIEIKTNLFRLGYMSLFTFPEIVGHAASNPRLNKNESLSGFHDPRGLTNGGMRAVMRPARGQALLRGVESEEAGEEVPEGDAG